MIDSLKCTARHGIIFFPKKIKGNPLDQDYEEEEEEKTVEA